MKKLYNLCLLAVMLLGVTFSAKAQDEDDHVSVTVTWDTPGSVIIYDGSVNESKKVQLGADQTSYTAENYDGWGSVYVVAASGYVLTNAVCEEASSTITPITYLNPPRLNIPLDSTPYTYKVNLGKVEYDGNITINFVSGGEVTATFGGTNREYVLKGGSQTVPFSTQYETTITFTGAVNGSSNPYIKHNEETLTWAAKYSWDSVLKHDEITLADNDTFEVKYNDEAPSEPAEEITHNVTVSLAEGTPSSVISMIFNTTQKKSIYERDVFEVKDGDDVRFVFNTYDYTVTVNDETLTPTEGSNTTAWLTGAITDDMTVSISAVERDYGSTTVQIAVNTIEGLIARNGTYNGPIIDLTAITPAVGGYTFGGVTYDLYTIPVSLKSPKVFIEAEEGYWIKENLVGSGQNIIDKAMAAYDDPTPLRVLMHKISRDSRMAVYAVCGNGASTADFQLKTAQREIFPVAAGENLIYFDPEYDAPFSVMPIGINIEDVDFSVYREYNLALLDEDSKTYYTGIIGTDGMVLYIFDQTTPTVSTLTVTMPAGCAGSTVTYDALKSVSAAGSYSTFAGAPVVVTPATGVRLKVNGEAVALTDGSFSFTASIADTIEFLDPTVMVISPAQGETVESLSNIVVGFPNASTVTLNPEGDMTAMVLMSTEGWKYGNQMWEYAPVEDLGYPAYSFTPVCQVTAYMDYLLRVPEELFLINGTLTNAEQEVTFTVYKELKPEDLTWQIAYPTNGKLFNDATAAVTVMFDEAYTVALNTEDVADFTIKLGDNELEYYSEWDFSTENCYFSISVPKTVIASYGVDGKPFEGTLSIHVNAGALAVAGVNCPEMNYSVQLIPVKEFDEPSTSSTLEGLKVNPESPITVILNFSTSGDEAPRVKLFNQSFLVLEEPNYDAGRYYETATDVYNYTTRSYVKAAEAAEDTYLGPVVGIEFPAIGKVTSDLSLKFTAKDGAFMLDDDYPSAEYTRTYNGITTLVGTIILDATNGNITVYGLDGNVLLKDAPADALQSLPRGAYIVNGKKILK